MDHSKSAVSPARTFADPFYKSRDNSSKTASIVLGLDGLTVAILDQKENRIQVLNEYLFDELHQYHQVQAAFQDVIGSEDCFSSPFSKLIFGWKDAQALLIPEALFEEGNEFHYLRFSRSDAEDKDGRSDKLVNIDSRVVYACPSSISAIVHEMAAETSLIHASTGLLEYHALSQKRSSGGFLALHIGYSQFEILHFFNGQLKFYNSFQYTTAEDMLYYVLFVFEQLGLDQSGQEVSVSGQIELHDPAHELLQRYLAEVRFEDRNNFIQYSPALGTVPRHHYANLFHQFLCA